MKVRYGIQSPNFSLPITVNKDLQAGEYLAIGYNLQGISEQQLEDTKKTLEDVKQAIEIGDESQLSTLTQHDTIPNNRSNATSHGTKLFCH